MNMFCITFLCFMIVTVAGSTNVLNEFTALQKQKDLRALFSIGLRELDGLVETLEVWQICVRISEIVMHLHYQIFEYWQLFPLCLLLIL